MYCLFAFCYASLSPRSLTFLTIPSLVLRFLLELCVLSSGFSTFLPSHPHPPPPPPQFPSPLHSSFSFSIRIYPPRNESNQMKRKDQDKPRRFFLFRHSLLFPLLLPSLPLDHRPFRTRLKTIDVISLEQTSRATDRVSPFLPLSFPSSRSD